MSPTQPAAEAASILQRTAKGAGWIVGWRMATRFLGLGSTLVLARLLVPADFGLVALATAFVSSLDALSLLGVDDALIRIKSPRRALYDTAFTLNLIRGIATAFLLVVLAGPIATFFGDPRLADILIALAAGTVVVACHNIGTVDFRREISFHKEFRLFVLPRIGSVATTIGCALVWHSHWALVAGILAFRFLLTGYSYVMHPFRPRLTLSAWRDLVGFSVWTWLLSIVGLVRDRTDSFVIAHVLDTTAVGMFTVGTEIASLPSTELAIPLGTATFAGFAAGRNSDVPAGDTYLRVIGVVAAMTVPACVGISLLADPVVRLALGPNWLEAIPVIEVAALIGSTAVLGIVSNSLFSAYAYLGVMFRIVVLSMLLRVALLAALVPPMGIMGATLAGGIGMSAEYAIYVVLSCRRFAIPAKQFVSRVWRTLVASSIMAAVLFASGLGWSVHPGTAGEQVLRLIEGSLSGAIVYAVALATIWSALGRPMGPETDLLRFAGTLVSRLRSRRTPPASAPDTVRQTQ